MIDLCETNGCRTTAEVTYLGAPMCSKCKNEVQSARLFGGSKTMAVHTFIRLHQEEYKTGCTTGYEGI